MTAPRPRKGESSHVLCGTAPAPTRAFSPRQLPTDHVHAVPTREYQSDQSSRLRLGCHRPCYPKPVLKAHQRECVPPKPPVDVLSMPERCSPSRVRSAAPNYGAPLTAGRRSGQTRIATGGSGGNTRRPRPKTKAGVPPASRNAGRTQTASNPEGLDRSLHIRTGSGRRSVRFAGWARIRGHPAPDSYSRSRQSASRWPHS